MSEGDAEQDESEKTQMDGEQHEFWAFEFDYDVKSAIETAQVSKRTEKRTFSSISRLHFLKDD